MPKQTFWNLPAEKREALVQIALEEFAAHDFTSASISRVVARAGIAKGSLYQYFEDKQGLYLFLLDHAQQTLLRAIQADPSPAPDADFFALLRWQMSATVRAALAHPLPAQLVQRAYTSPLPFRAEVERQGQAARQAHLQSMIELAQTRGELSPGVDADTAALLVGAVIGAIGPGLLRRHGLDPAAGPVDLAALDPAVTQQLFDQVMAILEHGLRS
jgi:AcrR family transcriptional regulator